MFQSQHFSLGIISFIVTVFIINISAILLKGEIRYLSLLGFDRLKNKTCHKAPECYIDSTRTPVPISLGKIITSNFGASLKESLPPSSFATAFNFCCCFKPEVLSIVE